MNDIDRKLIADVLDGIATGCTSSVIFSGQKLLKLRPKIQKEMEHLNWWEINSEDSGNRHGSSF